MAVMKTAIFIIILVFTHQVWSQDLSADFKKLLIANKLPSQNQIFCLKHNGETTGVQIQQMQEIASVSKLYTTLYAFDALDVFKTYKTTFYIAGSTMHIAGGADPYFLEEKLFYLIDALNRMQIESLDKLTFDKNFITRDSSVQVSESLTTKMIISTLMRYLNTAKYTATEKDKLTQTRSFAKQENMHNQLGTYLKLKVAKIELSETNPIKDQNPLVFSHTSRPLHEMLKTMNVLSKNAVAQHVYEEAKKIKDFNQSLQANLVPVNSIIFLNGSGLPTINGKTREDNKASCVNILAMLDALKLKIEKSNLLLEDLISVGTDLGTLKKRFLNNMDIKESVIAKTGTLAMASTLAGFLSSDSISSFAILNKTSNASQAHTFQDAFIERIFASILTVKPLIYERKNIFPVPDLDFLESIN